MAGEQEPAWSPRRLVAGLRFAAGHGRHLAALAPDRRARLHLVLASILLTVKRKLGGRAFGSTRLRLVRGDLRFRIAVDELDDLAAIGEVLVDEEYRLPEGLDPRLIVDLGSHVGASLLYWRTTYPSARLVGVEPDPRTFDKLRRNVEQLDRVSIHHAAVAGSDGRVLLTSRRRSLTSSLKVAPGERGAQDVEVPAVSLDSLLAPLGEERIDVLKIDVEGAEYDVLAAAGCLDRVGAVVGELHPDLIGHDPADFLALLEGFEVEVERESPRSWRFSALRRGGAGAGSPSG